MTQRVPRPRRFSRRRSGACALPLLAMLAGVALPPPAATAQDAATSRGLPGSSGGVTVRRGLQTQPGGGPGAHVAPAPPAGPGVRTGPGAGFSAPGSRALLNLDAAVPCVQAARPDMSKAILCYRPLLEACDAQVGAEARLDCNRRAEAEWTALSRRYADQPMTRLLAGAFDPSACEAFSPPDAGQSREEARLQCRITARATQTIYGHIESLWGSLGRGL
ncbi:hypothetical protein P2H44_05070 [Albimonas sp. CAU 1670]|uniref:hypothetical protein n=1 Tax=Albimonas sp. CAU 1670 TaxID=3032599 RepID=UPI0023DA47FF|nr:hypothetical protein [Albimonas sp. CAU 1670]MDF2231917.1 hypothetical protein [Albimonas sp. CAU 1670]